MAAIMTNRIFFVHVHVWVKLRYLPILKIEISLFVFLLMEERVVIIPPANKVWGGYIGITLSVRPSMYLVSATPPKRLIGFL
jgi:hypothetical protein